MSHVVQCKREKCSSSGDYGKAYRGLSSTFGHRVGQEDSALGGLEAEVFINAADHDPPASTLTTTCTEDSLLIV